MLSLNIGKMPPEIATLLMLRGAQTPPLLWQDHANRNAKKTLDEIDDARLFQPFKVRSEEGAAGVRALLYLWNGWVGEAGMYAQAAAEADRLFIAGICERMQGRPDQAKQLFQKIGQHPVCAALVEEVLKTVGPKALSPLAKFREVVGQAKEWEFFAFVDLFEQARNATVLGIEQSVRNLQTKEFELLFSHLYRLATGRDPAAKLQEDQPVRKPRKVEPKRRSSSKSSASMSEKDARNAKGKMEIQPDVHVVCPRCRVQTTVPGALRGRLLKCQNCSASFIVPRGKNVAGGAAKPQGVKGVTIRCPGCGQVSSFPEAARGKKETCPKCGKMFLVPRAKAAASAQ